MESKEQWYRRCKAYEANGPTDERPTEPNMYLLLWADVPIAPLHPATYGRKEYCENRYRREAGELAVKAYTRKIDALSALRSMYDPEWDLRETKQARRVAEEANCASAAERIFNDVRWHAHRGPTGWPAIIPRTYLDCGWAWEENAILRQRDHLYGLYEVEAAALPVRQIQDWKEANQLRIIELINDLENAAAVRAKFCDVKDGAAFLQPEFWEEDCPVLPEEKTKFRSALCREQELEGELAARILLAGGDPSQYRTKWKDARGIVWSPRGHRVPPPEDLTESIGRVRSEKEDWERWQHLFAVPI